MIKSKVPLWALVVFCCFYFSFKSLASTTTTSPGSLNMNDGTITAPIGGCPSGTTAMAVNSTTQIRWGECVNTFAISQAINQALSQSGISIDKVHYSWKYIHCFNTPGVFCNNNISNRVNTNTGEITDDTYWDTLVVVVEVTDANGTVKKTETWTMDKWYDYQAANSHSTNEVLQSGTYWQVQEGNIELYNHIDKIGTIYTPNQLGDLRFRITGADKGNWDGYYGPILKDLQTWFTYRANPCQDTALYDPSCPGYSEAYAQYEYDQACTADALYDVGCPGYATAYFNQQCTLDPLSDSACPGYADAYFIQQCTANPLYNEGCDGYAAAYYTQQCTLNPLYDSGCDGYAAAYLKIQCDANPLYDKTCDGYETAYYNQQCTANPLYDSGCTGYFEAQCDANPLYDIRCTGYQTAYFNQQCLLNPQYDSQCTGYVAPIVETDADDIVDDGTGTGDAIVDSVIDTTPPPVEVIILPAPSTPAPPPVEVVVVPVEVETVEVVTVEQELEAELENIEVAETEVEVVEVETTSTTDESTVEETTVEEVVVEETVEEETTNEVVEETVEEENTENTEVAEAEDKQDKEEVKEKEVKEEVKDEETKSKPVTSTADKPSKKTKVKKITKAEKQKAKRKKMKEIIKKKLAALAVTMGKAQELKDQQALQAQIAALINFVPGFNSYGKAFIPGVNFYQPDAIYLDKKVPENRRGLRNGLAQQLLHEKMIDLQYKEIK